MCRFPSLAALLVVLTASPALAQTAPAASRDLEAYASIGYGAVSRFEDSTDFGGGLAIGGGFGFRPFKRVGFEFDVYSLPSLQESVRSAFVATPAIVVSASSDNRVQPYVVAGFGAVVTRHRQSSYLVRQDLRDFTDTGWGPVAGAGVRIKASSRISARVDARFNAGILRSRENLDARRFSVAVSRHW